MVLVSVTMSSFNHEKFISETIESVLNQTFKDFELIIVDDYSSDNSREIIKRYQEKDGRIKVLFHDENKGIAKTMNDAFDMAQGKFIAHIDSDDVWVEHKLETQLKILQKNENLIVWSEGQLINEEGRLLLAPFTAMYAGWNKKKRGNLFLELIHGNYIFDSTLMFKKDLLGDLRLDETYKLLNDHLFLIMLAWKYNFYYIKDKLAKYRIHRKNTYRSNVLLAINESILMYSDILKLYYNEIPKKVRWFINSNIIKSYLMYKNKKKARPYIIDAIRNYPQNILNYWYLYKSFIKIKHTNNFLNKKYEALYNYFDILYSNKIMRIKTN